MCTHLYLIRHAMSIGNRNRRFQGQENLGLDPVGVQQAKALAGYLSSLKTSFHKIYSSPLKRTQETAKAITNNLCIPVVILPKLAERDMGQWQGKSIDYIRSKHSDWERILSRGGLFGIEPMEAIQQRMLDSLTAIAQENTGKNILVVSHGMIISSAIKKITRGEKTVPLKNTSITHLVYSEEDGFQVKSVGKAPHLELMKSSR